MLRAHRQAWAWQDEYYGLTIDDIRELERQTQEALKEKYIDVEGGEEGQIPIPESEVSDENNRNVTNTNLVSASQVSDSIINDNTTIEPKKAPSKSSLVNLGIRKTSVTSVKSRKSVVGKSS